MLGHPRWHRSLLTGASQGPENRPAMAGINAPGMPVGRFFAERRSPALRVVGVTKHFGGVQALFDVTFEVQSGEVVALVGDNGAGKSTIVKIVSGVLAPDAGEIMVDGQSASIDSPAAARALGVHTVYQDLALADNLDAVENLYLGNELVRRIGWLTWIDFREMARRTKERLADLGVATIRDVHLPVSQLSGGQRQTIAMARATLGESKVLLLDEPTAALGVQESRHVLDLILQLREQGVGVLVVSHNIQDVFEVADRVVVLRLGRIVAILNKSEVSPEKVVGAIMGVS